MLTAFHIEASIAAQHCLAPSFEATNWLFIKLHTHGAQEKNHEALLGEPRHRTLNYLERAYNDGRSYRLHYVTAREMYELIKLAERGDVTDPGPSLRGRR